jgi:hypothetical protein
MAMKFMFREVEEISLLDKEILASQEELCSIELFVTS